MVLGVGADPDLLKRVLGGAIGIGLRKIVQDTYESVVSSCESGDEIYIFGFSRGAYAARALAGLIDASGIHRTPSKEGFAVAWNHYRVKPTVRKDPVKAGASDKKAIDQHASLVAQNAFHQDRSIKCVAVWDTVGSYGSSGRNWSSASSALHQSAFLGFRDTSFGQHIDVGLHAVAVDERRRPFVPTF